VTKGTTKVRPIKSEAIDELVLLKLIKPEKENKVWNLVTKIEQCI